jgi:hypothetical protein
MFAQFPDLANLSALKKLDETQYRELNDRLQKVADEAKNNPELQAMFFTAVRNSNSEFIKLFLEHNMVDVQIRDADQKLALTYAAEKAVAANRDSIIVGLIIKAGGYPQQIKDLVPESLVDRSRWGYFLHDLYYLLNEQDPNKQIGKFEEIFHTQSHSNQVRASIVDCSKVLRRLKPTPVAHLIWGIVAFRTGADINEVLEHLKQAYIGNIAFPQNSSITKGLHLIDQAYKGQDEIRSGIRRFARLLKAKAILSSITVTFPLDEEEQEILLEYCGPEHLAEKIDSLNNVIFTGSDEHLDAFSRYVSLKPTDLFIVSPFAAIKNLRKKAFMLAYLYHEKIVALHRQHKSWSKTDIEFLNENLMTMRDTGFYIPETHSDYLGFIRQMAGEDDGPLIEVDEKTKTLAKQILVIYYLKRAFANKQQSQPDPGRDWFTPVINLFNELDESARNNMPEVKHFFELYRFYISLNRMQSRSRYIDNSILDGCYLTLIEKIQIANNEKLKIIWDRTAPTGNLQQQDYVYWLRAHLAIFTKQFDYGALLTDITTSIILWLQPSSLRKYSLNACFELFTQYEAAVKPVSVAAEINELKIKIELFEYVLEKLKTKQLSREHDLDLEALSRKLDVYRTQLADGESQLKHEAEKPKSNYEFVELSADVNYQQAYQNDIEAQRIIADTLFEKRNNKGEPQIGRSLLWAFTAETNRFTAMELLQHNYLQNTAGRGPLFLFYFLLIRDQKIQVGQSFMASLQARVVDQQQENLAQDQKDYAEIFTPKILTDLYSSIGKHLGYREMRIMIAITRGVAIPAETAADRLTEKMSGVFDGAAKLVAGFGSRWWGTAKADEETTAEHDEASEHDASRRPT